ncbi:MAG: DUF1013 domain-containing protein [Alphaproteobacteria bacterium]
MNRPLMPKATAVWLVDNTSLSFDQIADYCGLHPLEVKGIADGEVAVGIKGEDPIASGQLTTAEIERCAADASTRLKMAEQSFEPPERRSKGPRYTPLSKRQDRPNAIAWLVRNHPELSDAQVSKLVGTTKPTINSVRERTHWNMSNIKPQDPVTLGLCSQTDLDAAVQKGQDKLRKQQERDDKATAKARAEQLAAAEAAGMPSTQPYEAPELEPAPEPKPEPEPEPEPAYSSEPANPFEKPFGDNEIRRPAEEEAEPEPEPTPESVFSTPPSTDNSKS